MNKIVMWLANIISEKAVHDTKEAWRIITVIIITFLLCIWLHEVFKHGSPPMEDIPSNALAQ